MRKRVKTLLSLLLVLVLTLGIFPAHAMADGADTEGGADDNAVTVYMSVSKHGQFIDSHGTVETMALQKITVPYFDLALYGLDMLYYNPDCYAGTTQVGGTPETAAGKVTLLHLIIYATEIYQCCMDPADAGKGQLAEDGWPWFEVYAKVPGSAFINFWDFGQDLNYYLNYEYPLGKLGWGSTCDQILLSDGDVVSFRYNKNTGNDGTYYHFGEKGLVSKDLLAGNSLNLTLFECTKTADYSGTGHVPVGAGHTVTVTDEIGGQVLATGTTDAYGDVRLDTSKLAAGTYYVTSNTYDPAVMLLNVTGNGHSHRYTETVTAPTCTEGGYTSFACSCGHSYVGRETSPAGHSPVNGVCTVCSQPVGGTPELCYGDLNGDSGVDAADAVMVYAIANGKMTTATEAQLAAADVNADSMVDAADAVIIYSYANGKIAKFPAQAN